MKAANKSPAALASGHIVEVNDKDSLTAVVSAAGLTVVDYWAPWCKNCKKINPVLARLASELSAVQFVKVNTQDAEALAAEQGVDALPSLQFFKGGKLVGSFKGSDAAKVEEAVRGHL